ncbi:MAG: RnfABCDGE type electron transport complex subunit A [Ruminococcaceae bacterium]|nr:RnfABCDGE type electron transport complex subunit A [Oscillospiraceae bacterium]
MNFFSILSLALGAILIENFVLVQFLGICPFLGVSKKPSTAFGMGMAVIFVMTLSSAVTYLVNDLLLVPFGLEYMQTVAFILIIAGLVQFVEMFMKKYMPPLYRALGIYLPLITTNCAVLGVTLINTELATFLEAVIYGCCAGIGFTLAILLFSVVRERVEMCGVPKAFEGIPAALISAGMLALAFMGFSGLSIG